MSEFRERLTGPVARDAYVFALPIFLTAAALAAFGFRVGAGVAVVLGVACLLFFRNPARAGAAVTANPAAVLAPADGRVLCVDEVENAEGARARRIGIFLSIFDVHINRAPVTGRVVSRERSGAQFLAAFNPRAAGRNVQLALGLVNDDGQRVDVVQITGLIARRIVCHAQRGDALRRGARYGLIRFGSRTDLLLPLESTLHVKRGDRVRGGQSIVATLPPTAQAQAAA